MQKEFDAFLTRDQASIYLTNTLGIPVKVKTLCKYATSGEGPKYQKFGNRRVLYSIEALEEWAKSKLSKPVTGSFEFMGKDYDRK